MKAPVQLIWNLIGDVFENMFNDEQRRPIEAFWQSMSDLAADGVGYIERYKNLKNIFTAKPFAYYGTMKVEPTEIEGFTFNGVILGCRNNNIYVYTTDSLPRDGYVGYNDRSYLFSSSSFTSLSSISGDLYQLQSTSCPTNTTASYLFSGDISRRWEDQGSEPVVSGSNYLEMSPPGMNWCIIKDKQYMSGASAWAQIWKFKIDEWNDVGFKSIALNTFGDTGPKYEIRIETDGQDAFIKTGIQAVARSIYATFQGNTVTRSSGNFIVDGFRKGYKIEIKNASEFHDGFYNIEEVTASTITFEGVAVDGEFAGVFIEKVLDIVSAVDSGISVGDDIEMRISHDNGNIRSRVSINGKLYIQNTPFEVSPGRRSQTFDFFSSSGDSSILVDYVLVPYGEAEGVKVESSVKIARHYPYVYYIEEPIVACDHIRSEPWDITIDVDVISEEGGKIELVADEDWNGYLPPQAILGTSILSLNDDETYDIVYDGITDKKLKVWSDKFQWIKTSTFALSRRLHFDDGVWLIGAEGREVDLYGRNGQLVGLPQREDSQGYLDVIRGMQFGLLKPPTKDNMESGISILLGAPYTVKGGVIREVGDDYVLVDNEKIKYSIWWKPYLKDQGQRIPPMTPIVEAVNAYDWVSDHEEIKKVTNIWKSWGTIFVKIPSQLGASIQGLNDTIRYIQKTKNKRTDYVVSFEARGDEDESQLFDGFTILESYTSTEEDLVFDDGGAVVNNDTNPEDQQESLWNLETSGMLDEAHALDSQLTKFRAKFISIGDGFKEYIHRGDSGIHLKRALTPTEVANGFTKTPLRFDMSGGARPNEIVRVLDTDGTLWATPQYTEILATSPDVFVGLEYSKIGSQQVLWQDLEGITTPVTAIGDPIGCVRASDTGVIVAAATTLARRPTWGGPGVGGIFNGVDNALQSPDTGSPGTGSFTTHIHFRPANLAANGDTLVVQSSSNYWVFRRATGSIHLRIKIETSDLSLYAPHGFTEGVFSCVGAVLNRDTNTMSLMREGVIVGNAAPPAGDLTIPIGERAGSWSGGVLLEGAVRFYTVHRRLLTSEETTTIVEG